MARGNDDPLAGLANIDELISNGGEISIGQIGPVKCAATACDDDNCLAMLQRRSGETLYQLLVRLNQAIALAWDKGQFTDEINTPSE